MNVGWHSVTGVRSVSWCAGKDQPLPIWLQVCRLRKGSESGAPLVTFVEWHMKACVASPQHILGGESLAQCVADCCRSRREALLVFMCTTFVAGVVT